MCCGCVKTVACYERRGWRPEGGGGRGGRHRGAGGSTTVGAAAWGYITLGPSKKGSPSEVPPSRPLPVKNVRGIPPDSQPSSPVPGPLPGPPEWRGCKPRCGPSRLRARPLSTLALTRTLIGRSRSRPPSIGASSATSGSLALPGGSRFGGSPVEGVLRARGRCRQPPRAPLCRPAGCNPLRGCRRP